jgi:hypothetical protein
MCFKNQHTFTWGSSTTADATPLSLRCACGAMRREDVPPFLALQAENARLTEQLRSARAALQTIRDQYGKVCDGDELCHHTACGSSAGAWFVADAALRDEGHGSP